MKETTTLTAYPTTKIVYITAALMLLTGAIYFYVASQDYADISQSAHLPTEGKNAQDILATTNEMIFFIIMGLGYTALGIYTLENTYRNKISYIMAIVGSLALILFYILTRTVNIPSIGIQDDVGATDVLTKVMQTAIVVLSVYILVSLTKRKSQTSVQILEYEERQSQAVDKNQKRNKESDFSSYK
jgi:predicted pyridoxine 5'-phosphate oxidase superfamily flavin-nucleotide-binding protein